MSEQTPKQQLMIARQQLDKLSIFIANLADFFKGTSPNIDDEFQQIKKLLAGKPDYDKAAQLSVALNAQLKQERKFLRQKNADTFSQIQQSLRLLVEVETIEPSVKSEIKSYIQTSVPSDGIDPSATIRHFEQALVLFKQALSNNSLVSQQKEKTEQQYLHEQITQELKGLIAPFLVTQQTNQIIADINKKLIEGLDEKELLECCLATIRFVIKDLITEASAASRLIKNIHQSLVKINLGITTTIKKSQSRQDKHQQQNQLMKAQISALEKVVSDCDEIDDLKQQTSSYLSKLHDTLDLGEQEEKNQQDKTIALLTSMQQRLDILEKQAQAYQQKLRQQRINALTDPLTKLPNRLAYEEKIHVDFKRLQSSKQSAYMAILDIDHFKKINDKYGHSVGDKTLQIIAKHIRKYLANNDFLARWGGEEFIAILYDESQSQALKKVENLRQTIAKLPFMFKGNRVSVTLSIGLVNFVSHKSSIQAFDVADKLLYKAKELGRNQTCTEEKE